MSEGGALLCDITTRLGVITIRLFELDAPATVRNFVALATGEKTGRPFYDGLTFHRCVPDFVIQGGCPNGDGTGDAGYALADEFGLGLKHDRAGIVSMANDGPNTGGSQFFITERATPWLNAKHAIFGEVVAGLLTVRRIAREPADADDRPRVPIVMEQVRIYRALG